MECEAKECKGVGGKRRMTCKLVQGACAAGLHGRQAEEGVGGLVRL